MTFVLTSNLHPRVAPHVERRATSRREPPEPFPILSSSSSSSSSKSSQNAWMKGPHSTALRTIESHGSGPTTISISIAMRRRFSSSAPDLLAPPCHPSSPSTARRAHQLPDRNVPICPDQFPFRTILLLQSSQSNKLREHKLRGRSFCPSLNPNSGKISPIIKFSILFPRPARVFRCVFLHPYLLHTSRHPRHSLESSMMHYLEWSIQALGNKLLDR